MPILLHLAAAALYAAAAWARWPHAARRAAARRARWLPPLALVAARDRRSRRAIATPQGLDISLANALSLVAALSRAGRVGVGRSCVRCRQSRAVVLPVAAVAALLPALVTNPHRFPTPASRWAAAHIAVALLAYAFFLVAALQALLMTGLEKRLHRGLPRTPAKTPPLLTLERYLFRLVGAGLRAADARACERRRCSPSSCSASRSTLTHKNVFSVARLARRSARCCSAAGAYGWRGRTALRWILAGTALLVLAYLGSKFVLEVAAVAGIGKTGRYRQRAMRRHRILGASDSRYLIRSEWTTSPRLAAVALASCWSPRASSRSPRPR